MTFERYQVINRDFHCLLIEDTATNKKYGCFNRFERGQLEKLCNDLNKEQNQGGGGK